MVDVEYITEEEGNNIFLITARYAVEGFDIRGITEKWLNENIISRASSMIDKDTVNLEDLLKMMVNQ